MSTSNTQLKKRIRELEDQRSQLERRLSLRTKELLILLEQMQDIKEALDERGLEIVVRAQRELDSHRDDSSSPPP